MNSILLPASYDKVFLIQENEMFLKCLERGRKKDSSNYLLLISNTFRDEYKKCGFTKQFLTQKEMEKIRDLYYMYEFSNRFRVISREDSYGNIFNLVDNGILTDIEAIEALLK